MIDQIDIGEGTVPKRTFVRVIPAPDRSAPWTVVAMRAAMLDLLGHYAEDRR